MRTEEEILRDDPAGVPFSNSTSWEIWAANNCGRSSGCVNDDAFGNGPEGTACPLITASLLGKWPTEWPNVDGSPGCCTEYEEVVAHATDDEPLIQDEGTQPIVLSGQMGLFDPTDPGSTFPGQGGL